METPSGASDAGANTDTLPSDNPDGSTTSDTPAGGSQESTDKQLADKDKHIVDIEKQNKDLEAKNKTLEDKAAKTTDPSDVLDWKIEHLDEIKMGGEEYKKELNFFKDQGIKVTPAIMEKALQNAKNTKGMSDEPNTADDATTTAAPAAGETRATKAKKTKVMPEWLKRSKTMTEERWNEEVAKKETEKAGK